MSWTGISCPECSARIRKKDVTDRFNCPSCGATLMSNRIKARLIMFGICLVALPAILVGAQKIALFIFGPTADFSDKQLVVFLLYIGLILLVYPWLLAIKKEKQPEGRLPSSTSDEQPRN
jgi:predicted RNA-binding Zn-ribbon protein involved in translation (DUF1610 family)